MPEIIDAHVHVGLVGDQEKDLGGMSAWYRQQPVFAAMRLFLGIEPDQVCDAAMRQATLHILRTMSVDSAVCLALDHVYTKEGVPRKEDSHVWVDNRYILELQKTLGARVRFGCSVHPFDVNFETRVAECVKEGAVLIKWIPSAQQFSLAEPLVLERMRFLATVKNGGPLPILLHIGPEYAIPSADPSAECYNYLSLSLWERALCRLKGKHDIPPVADVDLTIMSALDAGAVIIFAHCGLPYFAGKLGSGWLEHSDFEAVRRFVTLNTSSKGRCYADVSAVCTPLRFGFFKQIRELPPDRLIYGSDFPTPVFELFRDAAVIKAQFEALRKGDVGRLFIPKDNLLDVYFRQMRLAFAGHPMFENFAKLVDETD